MNFKEKADIWGESFRNWGGVNDKKLLWRANLYIDETLNEDGTASGNADWNNLNQWNSTDNEWRGTGNGGQIDIQEWTRYDFTPDVPIYDSVAYSHGCADSPADFNLDMIDQRDTIRAWYTVNPIQDNSTLTNTLKVWDNTLAPNGVWGISEDNATINYRFGIPVTGSDAYDYIILDTNNDDTNEEYYPYTPGFSSKKNNDDNNYESVHTCYSAGVDCSSFIQRCSSYLDNQYDANTIAELRNVWNNSYPSSNRPLEGEGGLLNSSWLISDTNLIVPGDIIYITGLNVDQSRWWHFGIIDKINNIGINRQITSNNVFIIEATGYGMKVRKNRTWYSLDNISGVTLCEIRRLKTN